MASNKKKSLNDELDPSKTEQEKIVAEHPSSLRQDYQKYKRQDEIKKIIIKEFFKRQFISTMAFFEYDQFNEKLKAIDKRVYHYIVNHGGYRNNFFQTNKKIATALSCSESSVSHAITQLVKLGYIKVISKSTFSEKRKLGSVSLDAVLEKKIQTLGLDEVLALTGDFLWARDRLNALEKQGKTPKVKKLVKKRFKKDI